MATAGAAVREGRIRVLADGRYGGNRQGGVAVYVREMLEALKAEPRVHLTIVTNERSHVASAPSETPEYICTRVTPEMHPLADMYLHWVMPRAARQRQMDIVWGPAFMIPWGPCRVKRVVTMHDLTVFSHPAEYPARFAAWMRLAIRRSAAAASAIVAVSEATAAQIRQYIPEHASRTVVIPSAVPNHACQVGAAAPLIPKPYVLLVGHGTPRKNAAAVAALFASGRITSPKGHRLVVVGEGGDLPGHPSILRLPPCEPAQLAALYAHADLLVVPSHWEGFGFPMLEAMANGCPVAAARRGALPEVGGNAAAYFDPDNADEMAAVINFILENTSESERLRNVGMEHVKGFSWTRTTDQLVNLFHQVILGPGHA